MSLNLTRSGHLHVSNVNIGYGAQNCNYFLIHHQYCVVCSKEHLNETFLIITHNKCLDLKIRKLTFDYT